jgi:hypothetical protein
MSKYILVYQADLLNKFQILKLNIEKSIDISLEFAYNSIR